MKRILIIGTRPNMEHRLERTFKDRAALTFFNDIMGSAGLDAIAKQHDHIVMNIRLARHGHQYVLTKTGRPFVRTNGAASAIVRAVEELI